MTLWGSAVIVSSSADENKIAIDYRGFVQQNFQIFGYARSNMDDSSFREMISGTLTCRVDAGYGTYSWMQLLLQSLDTNLASDLRT